MRQSVEYLKMCPKKLGPYAVILAVVAGTAYALHGMGRPWSCACGGRFPWAGDIWSSHNSQHLADPYSVTHVLHGVLFCGVLALIMRKRAQRWWLPLVVIVEALWEVAENSPFIIQRYREATFALGYTGDTVLNSMGDILFCGLGFLLARRLGFGRSVVLFVAAELVLAYWIHDNLTLNILMLIHPVAAVKAWQMIH